jgi:hypothetical protein
MGAGGVFQTLHKHLGKRPDLREERKAQFNMGLLRVNTGYIVAGHTVANASAVYQ